MVDVLKTLSKLPELCAATLPGSTEAIIIRRGVVGYYPAPIKLRVDDFNQRHGVTDAQREAMLIGSCFGWEVPGADPDSHLEA